MPKLIRAVRYRELRDAAMASARWYPPQTVGRIRYAAIAREANHRLVRRLQIAHGKRSITT